MLPAWRKRYGRSTSANRLCPGRSATICPGTSRLSASGCSESISIRATAPPAGASQHCAGLPCEFIQGDVRQLDFSKLAQGGPAFDPAASDAAAFDTAAFDAGAFDAAIYIYGQFTVLRPAESRDLLRRIQDCLLYTSPSPRD